MKSSLARLGAGLAGTFVAATINLAAFAGDFALTSDHARRFADSIPAAVKLGETFKDNEDLASVFERQETPFINGEFKPYSRSVSLLKTEFPSAYGELSGAVKPHGFKDALDWAKTGDATMIAYMALKLPPESMAMAAMMTPEMMKMMPPEARAQYENAMTMMKAVSSVPQADRDAVTPVLGRLDAALEDAAGSGGAFVKLPKGGDLR